MKKVKKVLRGVFTIGIGVFTAIGILVVGFAIYGYATFYRETDEHGNVVWLDNYTDINDFDYTLKGDDITIGTYNGHDDKIHIAKSYMINGKEYQTTYFSDVASIFSKVETSVIFPEGTLSLGNHYGKIETDYIFIPDSVTSLDPDFKGCYTDLNIYYGGTMEQWEKLESNLNDKPDRPKTMLSVRYDVPINRL